MTQAGRIQARSIIVDDHRSENDLIAPVIVVGAWSMIFMTALMRGMVDDMVKDGISVLPGHVQIHHPDYRDDPTIANVIEAPSGDLLEALARPEVVAWTTRVRVPAVISSPWTSSMAPARMR